MYSQSIPAARTSWGETLLRVVDPVFDALAAGRLRASMPVELPPGSSRDSSAVAHLEAVGRCLQGVGPWLACPDRRGSLPARRVARQSRRRTGACRRPGVA